MHCFARTNQHLWLRTFEPTWVVHYITYVVAKPITLPNRKSSHIVREDQDACWLITPLGKSGRRNCTRTSNFRYASLPHVSHISIYAQNPESNGCLKPGTPTGMPPHQNAGNVCTYLGMYAISSRSGGLFGRTYGYRNAGMVLELALTSQMHIIHTYVCQEEIYARKGFLEWHDSCVLLGFSRYLDGVVEESGKLCSMWMDRWDAEPYPLNWMANLLFASWIRYWYPSPHNTPPPPQTFLPRRDTYKKYVASYISTPLPSKKPLTYMHGARTRIRYMQPRPQNLNQLLCSAKLAQQKIKR